MALLVATRHDLALVHARFRDIATLPVRGRPARRQYLGDAAGCARGPPRRATVAALALDADDRRRLGRGAANERPSAPSAAARGCSARPRRRRPRRTARAFRRQRPTRRRAFRARRAAWRTTFAATGNLSGTATSPSRGRSTAYQTVFALEPGSAEMPSAGRPFTAALVTELVARGVLVAPVTLHTGRLLARARRATLPRALPRAGRDSQARQRRSRLERARDRGRHDCCARTRDGGRSGRHGVGWSGLDESRGNTRARAARDRRPPHRVCTNANPHTSSCSKPRPVPSSSSAPTRPRSRTATSGTSSATST